MRSIAFLAFLVAARQLADPTCGRSGERNKAERRSLSTVGDKKAAEIVNEAHETPLQCSRKN